LHLLIKKLLFSRLTENVYVRDEKGDK